MLTTKTMIDNNDDVFLNLYNNPNPLAAFNNIMRQYYNNRGNPVKQRQQQTNENREKVSSIQGSRTRKEAFTLDLLWPKHSRYVMTKEEARKAGVGEELLASTTEKDSFDIRNYLTRVYGNEQQQRLPPRGQQNQNINSNKLTLADLLNAREKFKSITFIKQRGPEY